MKKQLLFLVMMLLPMIAHADKSGTCGDNLTWTLVESTGTLTIEGSGAMKDYSYGSAPWYEDRTKISTVVIGDGVTNIGNYAFCQCADFTSINIPNSVTSIGESAFNSCSMFTSVTISNSIMSIGAMVFYGCKRLTSIEIPNSVTSIGYGAFYGCSMLTSVTISNSMTDIGSGAFNGCYRLSRINCLNPIPPSSVGDTFICKVDDYVRDKYDIYNYAILNVPKGSKDAYSSAYEWRYFKNIKEIGEETSSGTNQETGTPLKGDVNGDGVVSAQDASLILQYVAGKITW